MSESTATHPETDDLRQTARDTADDIRAAAAERATQFRDAAAPHVEEARETVNDLLKEGERYVRENPGRAVLTALGVGFVLGAILKR